MPKTCINVYKISSMKMRMTRIKVDVMYRKQQERLGREPASDVVAGVSLIYQSNHRVDVNEQTRPRHNRSSYRSAVAVNMWSLLCVCVFCK